MSDGRRRANWRTWLGHDAREICAAWGGTTGHETRTDFIDYDHIYIAGEPL